MLFRSRNACVSYTWPVNGQTYSSSGTYTRRYTNANGCSSADTLKLTIYQGNFSSTIVNNCGPYFWSASGQTYSTSGTYTRNYNNANGCTSTDTLKLTVNTGTYTSTSIPSCGSYIWPANGQIYNSSGVYIRNYNNNTGCASADTLKLTINQGNFTSTSVSSCDSYIWPSNNQTYTLSGVYVRNYVNTSGCPSADTLKLTINQGSYTSTSVTSCNSYNWPINNQTYNATGTYIRTYTNGNGCPSADTLKLTINQGTFTSTSVTNCGSYIWNGITYTSSGTYVRNYTNTNGCASADTLKLTVKQSTYTSTTVISCGSYFWVANGQT